MTLGHRSLCHKVENECARAVCSKPPWPPPMSRAALAPVQCSLWRASPTAPSLRPTQSSHDDPRISCRSLTCRACATQRIAYWQSHCHITSARPLMSRAALAPVQCPCTHRLPIHGVPIPFPAPPTADQDTRRPAGRRSGVHFLPSPHARCSKAHQVSPETLQYAGRPPHPA